MESSLVLSNPNKLKLQESHSIKPKLHFFSVKQTQAFKNEFKLRVFQAFGPVEIKLNQAFSKA